MNSKLEGWIDGWMRKCQNLGKDKESKANARVSKESCRVNRKRIFFFLIESMSGGG